MGCEAGQSTPSSGKDKK